MGSISDHLRIGVLPNQNKAVNDRFISLFSAIFMGNGSPEGVVTAEIGAIYMRIDGGAGSTLYVKESGSGNTGWGAVTGGGLSGADHDTRDHSTALGTAALGDLADVDATPPTDEQGLLFDTGTSVWRPATISAGTTHAFARKSADETDTTGVLQNDNHLFFAMAANETWVVDCILFVAAGAEAADIQIAWGVPTGAAGGFVALGAQAGITDPFNTSMTVVGGAGLTSGLTVGIDDTNASTIVVKALVRNGANAGNMQLRWAQASANAVATRVSTDSYLLAHKVA